MLILNYLSLGYHSSAKATRRLTLPLAPAHAPPARLSRPPTCPGPAGVHHVHIYRP